MDCEHILHSKTRANQKSGQSPFYKTHSAMKSLASALRQFERTAQSQRTLDSVTI